MQRNSFSRRLALLGVATALVGCSDSATEPQILPAGLEWHFLAGMEGWEEGVTSNGWGTVAWRDRRLGRDGVIHFDGVGGPGEPNSWIRHTLTIPVGSTTITLAAAPHDRDGGDVEMRVRFEGNSGSQTVLNWTLLVGAEGERRWAEFSAPIASIAGQTGTLYVEQRDNGPGSHEQLYIDSIEIN